MTSSEGLWRAVGTNPLHLPKDVVPGAVFAHRRSVSSIVSGAAEARSVRRPRVALPPRWAQRLVNASATMAATRIQNEQHDCDREQHCDSHTYDDSAIMDQILHHIS